MTPDVLEALEVLERAVDVLAGADPASLCAGDDLVRLGRVVGRLESVAARATRRFEVGGEWGLDGSRSLGSWLAAHLRIPLGQAKAQAGLGRALEALPRFAEAALAGQVGPAHVRVVDRVRRPETAGRLEADEELLVEQAGQLRLDGFVAAVKYWEQHADPDGTLARFDRQATQRSVSLVRSYRDHWFGQIQLDPVAGSVVAAELDRISAELFAADRRDAAQQLGRDPLPGELARTATQRRADALVEMARRSALVDPEVAGRMRPGPLFSVLVGYESLHGRICELEDGTVVPPQVLLRWMDTATFERVVFTPDNRVEVSRTARFFTGATRRVVEVRDRVCQHPTCDIRLRRCQADHIVPVEAGGPTILENGRLLCQFHNRLRNNHDWDAYWAADNNDTGGDAGEPWGQPEPPPGIRRPPDTDEIVVNDTGDLEYDAAATLQRIDQHWRNQTYSPGTKSVRVEWPPDVPADHRTTLDQPRPAKPAPRPTTPGSCRDLVYDD